MNDRVEHHPTALAEVPMLAEYDQELAAPVTSDSEPFGVFSAEELRFSRAALAGGNVDWTQVVDLRRRASEIITDEAEEYARSSGRRLGGEDRLLLGRSIIRRVVSDHVRSLHRSGAE